MSQEKVKVKLSEALEKYGGGLIDPETKKNPTTICKAKYNNGCIEVVKTQFIADRLDGGDLVEVTLERPRKLEELTVAELDALAAEEKIDLSNCKNKQEKIDRINEQREQAG